MSGVDEPEYLEVDVTRVHPKECRVPAELIEQLARDAGGVLSNEASSVAPSECVDCGARLLVRVDVVYENRRASLTELARWVSARRLDEAAVL